ncbi:HupE / UreJ protein [Pseudoruegeria aquimaris]|uniref:HupE / UreJ protein n=1 Tax=Pseudoruegeria aquimaris TaxID=393663 RepID=A0A1Y5TN52_9RHOB|nr:HupE/UreJ family protein [Pseudoruegeria aquimaris]SLN64268.1 HupE / UreJ protein [Pseudoruegeria aquimaris]
MTRLAYALFALVLAAVALPSQGLTHALQPGYLEVQALGDDDYRAFWRRPDVQGRPMEIDALLPEACTLRRGPEPRFDGAGWVTQWITACPGGLAGGEIRIEGLEATRTDVLVRYEIAPGQGEAQRLTAKEPAFAVPRAPGAREVLVSYFGLGVEHILEGLDHLLFVFALLLLIRDRWRLLGAVTAFTVAHSFTLAAAALGWLIVPGPPVEAIIALSIMFLAAEVLKRGDGPARLSERFPWMVCFGFGLLHGLGFGSALLEIGLPQQEIWLALLAFNLGVEAGQILFILVVLSVGWLLARILPVLLDKATLIGATITRAVPYAVGGLAAFWFVERLAAF